MPRKNTLPSFQNIINGDMTTIINSTITCIEWLDNAALQLIWTGTPTGTFQVLGSVNHQEINGNVIVQGTFDPITLSPAPIASGAAGSILMNLNQLGFPYIQVIYTPVSGSGTLQGFISAKEI